MLFNPMISLFTGPTTENVSKICDSVVKNDKFPTYTVLEFFSAFN